MAGERILIVDDDEPLRASLAEHISLLETMEVVQAGDAAAALACVSGGHFDSILLDVGLPDMDGRDLCRLLRRQGVRTPILMLTAHDGDSDAILGLDAGANDYIVKPVRVGVLLARLRAHMRQRLSDSEAELRVGPFIFRPAAKILEPLEGGPSIRLTEKEAAILKRLYRAAGGAVSRERLLDEVWGYSPHVTTHTLETHIYRLRQKMEEDPADARLLITGAGGYSLNR